MYISPLNFKPAQACLFQFQLYNNLMAFTTFEAGFSCAQVRFSKDVSNTRFISCFHLVIGSINWYCEGGQNKFGQVQISILSTDWAVWQWSGARTLFQGSEEECKVLYFEKVVFLDTITWRSLHDDKHAKADPDSIFFKFSENVLALLVSHVFQGLKRRWNPKKHQVYWKKCHGWPKQSICA